MSFTPTPFLESISSTTMKEVSQETDFGTVVSETITLTANTTYFIRGNVSCSSRLIITEENISIVGWDRDKDGLTYTGSGEFITVTDVNFSLNNIKLSATNLNSLVLRASNFNYGSYNDGRDKVLTMVNCQFRNCYNVWHIEGFDLIDIQNNLVWYIQATTMGCNFKNVSKLQVSSCEYIRWFDETSLPTPSGYATTSMIELLANGEGNGFGGVNINGGIIAPKQTQNGIDIVTGSTTEVGTISGNTFVNTGLTTGKAFLGDSLTPANGAYSENECLNYDVFANQGLPNSTTSAYVTFTGNTDDTDLDDGDWQPIEAGGNAVLQNSQRFSMSIDSTIGDGTQTNATPVLSYLGTKDIYGIMNVQMYYDKQGGGNDNYTFELRKAPLGSSTYSLLSGSQVSIDNLEGWNDGSMTMIYQGDIIEGDKFVIVVTANGSNDDMLIRELQWGVKE